MPSTSGTASKKRQVSRQTLWQRRHREMGLCVVCSEPAYKGWRCVKHYEQHKINMRFRYIPRVRGRYNVGGVAETPPRTGRTAPAGKTPRGRSMTPASARPRRGKTTARYAKAAKA